LLKNGQKNLDLTHHDAQRELDDNARIAGRLLVT